MRCHKKYKKELLHVQLLFILSGILLLFSCNEYKKSKENILFDFENGANSVDYDLNDAEAKIVNKQSNHFLEVTLGHQGASSIKLNFPPKDFSEYIGLSMDIKNLGYESIAIEAQCFNETSDTIDITDGAKFFNRSMIVLNPGETDSLFITFSRPYEILPGYMKKYFTGMRGLPGGFVQRWENIDLTQITNISVFKQKSTNDYTFTIDNIRGVGKYDLPDSSTLANEFFPFVDQFGQYIHKTWKNKIDSKDDILKQMEEEKADLLANPGSSSWDEYGGWIDGPQLEATGHFRVEKYHGKWWLIDPNGRLFWSQGIVAIRHSQNTPIEERENYFTEIPDEGDFYRSNLKLKYGDNWNDEVEESASAFTNERMRSWGINTLAGSARSIYIQRKTPYTLTIRTGIPQNMPDTLDEQSFRKMFIGQLQREYVVEAAKDPWCIGFFVDNERYWPKQNTDEILEKYFRIVSEEMRKYAPRKLYMGSRINSRNFYRYAFELTAKYCDVISINHYDYNLSDFKETEGLDKPIIVGEFHFGALDRGLLHTGLRSVSNQNQRARVYKHFINQGLENPLIVGAHWFQYVDQVCTGRRGDGENYQIGFVDICDRPYSEMISAVRSIASYMYEYRLNGVAANASTY